MHLAWPRSPARAHKSTDIMIGLIARGITPVRALQAAHKEQAGPHGSERERCRFSVISFYVFCLFFFSVICFGIVFWVNQLDKRCVGFSIFNKVVLHTDFFFRMGWKINAGLEVRAGARFESEY